MVVFSRNAFQPRLYVADGTADDRGFAACLLSPDAAAEPSLPLDRLFPGADLGASFLLGAVAPALDTADRAAALVKAVDALLAAGDAGGPRALLWLDDPASVKKETVRALWLNAAGTETARGLEVSVARSTLDFKVLSGARLRRADDGNGLVLRGSGGGKAVTFAGAAAPTASEVTTAELPLAGTLRGCLRFDLWIQRRSLLKQLRWGFQYFFPVADDPTRTHRTQWYPLAAEEKGSFDKIGFQAAIDVTDLENLRVAPADADAGRLRTFLGFTGVNVGTGDPRTELDAYCATRTGERLGLVPVGAAAASDELRPARLTFALGTTVRSGGEFRELTLAPEGDFHLQAANGDGKERALLCGLSGTETLTVLPAGGGYAGDRLRFSGRRPACATRFPLRAVSTVGPPPDPKARLLDETFRTAWATVRRDPARGGSVTYHAQPPTAPLYGRDALHTAYEPVFGLLQPGYALPQADTLRFPLPPYAGVTPGNGGDSFTAAQAAQFEAEILEPTRRGRIAEGNPAPVAFEKPEVPAVTPTGVAVVIDGPTGKWKQVLLAQNRKPPAGVAAPIQLAFDRPEAPLQQALQSSGLFLVCADPAPLGAPGGYPPPQQPGIAAGFRNAITIDQWAFTAAVGRNSRYADYRNVVVVKGRSGARAGDGGGADAPAGSLAALVRNPDLWTARETFSVPVRDGRSDPAELAVLSQWLQDYVAAAARAADDPVRASLYARFNRIARDPLWTGVLVLRADVSAIPRDLQGLLGALDPATFAAHHVGADLGQIEAATLSLKDTSALFGLIDYVAPGYDPARGEQPVPPRPGATYDFKVLTLAARFENAAVRDFRSLAQLTLNQVLGQPVTGMGAGGNPYNTLLLAGSYQRDGEQSTYVLDSRGDADFRFDSNVLRKAEIVKARFTTVEAAGKAPAARFDLWGLLDFRVVRGEVVDPETGEKVLRTLDVFSFGGEDDTDLPRQGLYFSGLGLDLAYPGGQGTPPVFSLDTSRVAFDPRQSTPRRLSMFRQLALELDGLASGADETNTPASQGYLRVAAEPSLAGVGTPWHGLRFRLSMGTPGELAGKLKLTSWLLAAWSPGSGEKSPSYRAHLGISLPGTGGGARLLSLQGVLRLAIGEMKMSSVPIPGDADKRDTFLLNMNDIGLKFLGLLKLPPNGSTAFYLFGNPDAQGDPSELGWYAVYNQDAPKEKAALPARHGEPAPSESGSDR